MSFLLLGAGTGSFARSLVFQNVSKSEGLGDLLVNEIYQEPNGPVWFGTGSSLESFDGVYLQHYAIPEEKSNRTRVTSILSDKEHNLWVGNGNGLYVLPHDKTELEPVERGKFPEAVHALALSNDESLYIATEKGLFIYHIRNKTLEKRLVHVNELAPENALQDLAILPNDELWAVSKHGLLCYQTKSDRWQRFVLPTNPQQAFNRIAHVGEWIYMGSADHGLFRFSLKKGVFESGPDLNCPMISDLSVSEDGLLYVGTDGNGVFAIEPQTGQIVSHYSHRKEQGIGISSNSVYAVLCGNNNQLWFGFYEHGVDYSLFQSDVVQTYSYHDFDTQNLAVRALSIHGPQKMIGYRGGLFFVDEATGRTCSFGPNDLHSQIVFSICRQQDIYYIGTYGGGLYAFDASSFKLQKFPSFASKEIFCITQGPDSCLWFATEIGVYVYKDGVEKQRFTSSNSVLPQGNVYEIFFDSTGRGWICTESGMCLYDEFNGTLRTDAFPAGFIQKQKVRYIYEDLQHRLYFIPDKGQVSCYDLLLNKVNLVGFNEKMRASDGRFLVEDAKGRLYFGSQQGLFSRDREGNSREYNFSNGLTNPTFTLCKPVVDESGRLWMGNNSGLLFIDSNESVVKLASDSMHCVSGLKVNNQRIPLSYDDLFKRGEYHLAEQGGTLTFLLTEYTFTAPEAMNYEYQLAGVDTAWISLEGQSEVSYANLSWGSHTFKVRNCSDPKVEHQFVVRVPLTGGNVLRSSAILLAIIFAVAVCIGLYRRRRALRLLLNAGRIGKVQKISTSVPEEEENIAEEEEEPLMQPDSDKYQNINLSKEERDRLVGELKRVMEKERLYLRRDLKIADVADRIGTSPYLLSYLFNQCLQVNYYDFVNDYRIAEFKRIVSTVDLSKYTLPALAEMCGFSSRASFFRSFKKVTGITPNEYIKKKGVTEEQ